MMLAGERCFPHHPQIEDYGRYMKILEDQEEGTVFITSKIESHMAVQDESIVLFYNEVDTSVSAMCHVTLIMIY